MAIATLVIATIVLINSNARADEDDDEKAGLPLEELALMETAAVEEQLELQASLFPHFTQWPSNVQRSAGLGVALELGIFDWLELGARLPFEHAWSGGETATGLSNTELEIRAQLFSGNVLMLTAGVEAESPATDEMLGEDFWGVGPTLGADLRLGLVHIAVCGEWEFEFEGGEVEHAPTVGSAVYLDFGLLVPVAELLAVLEDDVDLRAALGLFANLGEEFEIGLSGYAGLTDAAPDFGIIGVVTLELELGGK